MSTATWTHRRNRTFLGIRGLDDRETVVPRLATIGRLHKGGEMREKEVVRGGEKKTVRYPGEDLDHFRFTSEREDVIGAFYEAYGAAPRVINCYLPYPSAEENFQTACEEWVAGGLVHRCDGETMTIWKDTEGGYHTQATKPCPYAAGEKERTRRNPGCRPVGRLYVVIPELVEAGYVGPVYLVTTSLNDIQRITAALRAVEEEQVRADVLREEPDLRGILFTLRRVPEKISTPGDNGQRVRRVKYLVVIEPAVSWVRAQLAMAREAQMPGYHELPPGPSQEPDWEDATTAGRTVAEIEGEARELARDAEEEAPGFAAQDSEGPTEEPQPDNGGNKRRRSWPGPVIFWALDNLKHAFSAPAEIIDALEGSGLDPDAGHRALEDYLHKAAARKTAAEVSPPAEEDPAGDPDIDWFAEDAATEWLRKIQAKAERSQAKGTPTQKMVGYAVSLLHQCWPDSPEESREILRKEFMTLVTGKASFKEWTYGEVKALLDALADPETKGLDQVAGGFVRALVSAAEAAAGQRLLFGEEEFDA